MCLLHMRTVPDKDLVNVLVVFISAETTLLLKPILTSDKSCLSCGQK